jgi:5-methylcytosine-specific restriction endonuclease McrA
MNKKIRETVYNKYNGCCAYTGKPLQSDWQVDHIHPKCRKIQKNSTLTSHDDMDNLIPAYRMVNHYKRTQTLNEFRKFMSEFHIRLSKLPKNTRVLKTQKRKEYLFEIAMLFDIAIDKPFDGKFYFEKL